MLGARSPRKALQRWLASPVRVLNLGCGHRTSSHPHVLNVDWSIFIRSRTSFLKGIPELVLSGERLARYRAMPDNILAYDVARGIPAGDASVDMVYHSHMLEHIPRDRVGDFLREVRRVLKPGGVHRIVVPDLELLVRRYVEHLHACEADPSNAGKHDELVADFLEQCVRDVPAGAQGLSGWRRALYLAVLGDARRRGEAHRWMYDRFNLAPLLESAGFGQVRVVSADTSGFSGWNDYRLDLNPDGSAYKEDSLYMEAVRE